MSGPIFWLPVVKISWEKTSKKKPTLLVNFCFLTHFDFSNTRIFSFSIGGKVMSPKMPLCNYDRAGHAYHQESDQDLHVQHQECDYGQLLTDNILLCNSWFFVEN